MKSLKKSLVFLVVLTMVLSTIAPVFAATPSDVVGTNYEEAVGKLVTLGVIAGYEDGTFKPDQSITRAEFSKIACYVVGVKDAAELSKGATKFKDVPATHWAAGYVNIASEKGMLKGYPDGTFKPEANVTYSEAVTILVRALGMGPVVEGKGTWPANYLSRAAAAGVTDDVTGLAATGNALRGAIAQLSWNTLVAEKWGEKEYTVDGIVYGPIGKSLLQEQYKDYVYETSTNKYEPKLFEDVDVVGTQLAGGECNKDEIYLSSEKLNEKVATKYEVLDKTADLNSFFGKKVTVLFGKDDKVAYIQATSKDVVEGFVDDFSTDYKKITINDKEYAVKTDAKIYLNNREINTEADLIHHVAYAANLDAIETALGNSTAKATLVLDSGKISAMNIVVADVLGANPVVANNKQFVVKEIKNDVVKGLNGASFDLNDVTADMDQAVFVKNGKPATEADIKVGDAVSYMTDGTLYVVMISDNKVTGKLTKISSADPAANTAHDTRKDLTIDGKVYSMVNDGNARMTKNGSLDSSDIKHMDDMKDFYNKDVTVTLNALGDILFVNGNTKGSSSANMEVGVVTRKLNESGNDYSLKVLTPAGDTKLFTVTGDKFRALKAVDQTDISDSSNYVETTLDSEVSTPSFLAVGKLVAYDASSDGKIDAKNLYALRANNIDDSTQDLYVEYVSVGNADDVDIKDTSEKLTTPVDTYYADSKTTFLNCNVANVEKIKDWNSIVSADKTTNNTNDTTNLLDDGAFYLVKDEDGNIRSIILSVADDIVVPHDADTDPDYLNTDNSYGIYIGDDSDSEDDYVTLNIKGTETRFVVSDVYNDFEKGDLVEYTLNGDGEIIAPTSAAIIADQSAIQDMVDADDGSADQYDVKTISGDKITFENGAKAVIASDAVVYDCRDPKKVVKVDFSSITTDMFIVATDLDDDDVYNVVAIVAE